MGPDDSVGDTYRSDAPQPANIEFLVDDLKALRRFEQKFNAVHADSITLSRLRPKTVIRQAYGWVFARCGNNAHIDEYRLLQHDGCISIYHVNPKITFDPPRDDLKKLLAPLRKHLPDWTNAKELLESTGFTEVTTETFESHMNKPEAGVLGDKALEFLQSWYGGLNRVVHEHDSVGHLQTELAIGELKEVPASIYV